MSTLKRTDVPISIPTLADAIALAARVHRDQRDKAGQAYILHPLRVMMRQPDETHQIVAVLHDVLEDSEVTAEDLRRSGYSEDVITAVESLTRGANETYDEFIERAAENSIARRVKLADLEDNLDITRLAKVRDKDLERMKKYHRARERLMAMEKGR
jgi:(p)ppGpp synthase/HD superfamily hydrolase